MAFTTQGGQSAVQESLDISSASLNLNARAASIRPSVAGIWELAKSTEKPPGEESELISHDVMHETGEAVVSAGGKDGRTLVEAKDFAPGGKYRSIVKLFCRHEFQPKNSWLLGTGWLIRDDLLITAGHCTYDWAHSYGRVVEVKAYIGYHGRQHASDPNVQLRYGRKVVAPVDWLTTKGQRPRDMGLIQLDKPFTGVTPIRYLDTPSNGKSRIGVVGYPGDKQDADTKEAGAHMYEMFKESAWNLALTENTMLEYKIDTYGGNSGSPVLVEGKNASIGVHVYGGSTDSLNSASVIGKLGNSVADYVQGFNLTIPKDNSLHLKIVSGALAESAAAPGLAPRSGFGPPFTPTPVSSGFRQRRAVGSGIGGRAGESPFNSNGYAAMTPYQPQRHSYAAGSGAESGEEGIFDIIKSIGNVALPMLGPVGIAANVALNVASKLAESVEAGGGAESVVVGGELPEGAAERAVMAEAALVALNKMNLSQVEEEGILSDIGDAVKRTLPVVKRAAMVVLPPMLEAGLNAAAQHLHQYNQSKGAAGGHAESYGEEGIFAGLPAVQNCWRPSGSYTAAIDRPSFNTHAEAVIASAESVVQEEGFVDFLKVGLRLGMQHGLPLLGKIISSAAGAESAEVGVHPSIAPEGAISTDLLAKRAVVGEAALQALLKLPPQRLQEEGFFDVLRVVAQKALPVVRTIAPVILDQVHPLAGQIARGVLGGGRQEGILEYTGPGLVNRPMQSGGFGQPGFAQAGFGQQGNLGINPSRRLRFTTQVQPSAQLGPFPSQPANPLRRTF